tara:strand:+ start:209 stop:409 length:201 start_codon:yes stop_codon:yes gene_type:complete
MIVNKLKMKKNNYLFFLLIFLFFDLSNEIKIIFDYLTLSSLYYAFLRHPLSFFMILSFPYLRRNLN